MTSITVITGLFIRVANVFTTLAITAPASARANILEYESRSDA